MDIKAETDDVLGELFVDKEKAVSDVLLKEILTGLVLFTTDGDILLQPAFHKLDTKQKMLVFLVAKKVL